MNRNYLGVILLCVSVVLGLLATPPVAMAAEGVNIHGFISQGFLYSDEYNYLANNSTDGSFEYNEFGINFSKNLADRFHMGFQLFSRDMGDVSNNKVSVDWAYGDYRFKDWLGLRAGRVKIPMGLYNETRDLDMLRTCIVLPQGIYNDLLRDNIIAMNGVGLYGNIDMGVGGGLEYLAVTGTLYSDENSGVGKITNDGAYEYGVETIGDTKNDTGFAGGIRWETPLSGLRVGYTCFLNDATTQLGLSSGVVVGAFDVSTEQHVGSAEFVWNDLTVAAEYLYRDATTTFGPSKIRTEEESYYLSASYVFTDWFKLGVYYAIYYPDKDDKDGDNLDFDHRAWEKDLALSLRFDINPFWVFKLEGHAVDGTANVLRLDNLEDDGTTDWTEDSFFYGAAKVTFNF